MINTPFARAWVIAGILGLSAAGITQPAGATTSTLDILGPDLVTLNGEASCTDSLAVNCQGMTDGGSPNAPTGLGTLSNTEADPYDLANSNESTVVSALNTLAGTSFDAGTGGDSPDATKVNVGSGILGSCSDTSCEFSTSAAWIVLNIDGWHNFIKNLTGGLLSFEYTKDANATIGGLSNVTFVGGVGIIPLPATLPLLLTGLLGLGFLARRRRQMAEA